LALARRSAAQAQPSTRRDSRLANRELQRFSMDFLAPPGYPEGQLTRQTEAKRYARGKRRGGPYIPLLDDSEIARREEELGLFLLVDRVLPGPA
jgi:hypothetical protein